MSISDSKKDVTQLLFDLSEGNRQAVDMLMPLVYKEMHQLAHVHLRKERPDHTLNATALVHEAYIKLIDQDRITWQNRAHFFGIASQAMRRILINYANARIAEKRGANPAFVTFNDDRMKRDSKPEELIALDEALKKLETLSERQSKIIEQWFFVGLNHEEIAEVLNVSVPTVRRDFRLAKAWLSRELRKEF
ncbi:MAG: ECF-type sigma factor [Ignavibacteriales bacterium]